MMAAASEEHSSSLALLRSLPIIWAHWTEEEVADTSTNRTDGRPAASHFLL